MLNIVEEFKMKKVIQLTMLEVIEVEKINLKMGKYYENFLSLNGQPYIVNIIQIDISLHLPSISTERTHISFYYIEVFQPSLKASHKH